MSLTFDFSVHLIKAAYYVELSLSGVYMPRLCTLQARPDGMPSLGCLPCLSGFSLVRTGSTHTWKSSPAYIHPV